MTSADAPEEGGRPARSAELLRTGLGQLPRHLALESPIAQFSLPSNAKCRTPSSGRANVSVDAKRSGSGVSRAVPRGARGPEPVKTNNVRSDRRFELVAGGVMVEVAIDKPDAVGLSRWRSCVSRGSGLSDPGAMLRSVNGVGEVMSCKGQASHVRSSSSGQVAA